MMLQPYQHKLLQTSCPKLTQHLEEDTVGPQWVQCLVKPSADSFALHQHQMHRLTMADDSPIKHVEACSSGSFDAGWLQIKGNIRHLPPLKSL